MIANFFTSTKISLGPILIVTNTGYSSPSLATPHNLSSYLKNIFCLIDGISDWVFYFLIHKLLFHLILIHTQQFKETSNYQEIQARKMPTERCAKLMLVGMANNLDELWISENPMLLMTYANQYFPTVFRWFSNEFLLERITKLYMKEN